MSGNERAQEPKRVYPYQSSRMVVKMLDQIIVAMTTEELLTDHEYRHHYNIMKMVRLCVGDEIWVGPRQGDVVPYLSAVCQAIVTDVFTKETSFRVTVVAVKLLTQVNSFRRGLYVKKLAALSQENSRRQIVSNKLKTIEELVQKDDNNSFGRAVQSLFKESILLDELKYELALARDDEREPSLDITSITEEELYREWKLN